MEQSDNWSHDRFIRKLDYFHVTNCHIHSNGATKQ